MLDTLANLAEILAGLAIIVSVIKLWPTFGQLVEMRVKRRIIAKGDLAKVTKDLSQLDGFTATACESIADVRDQLLAACVHTRSPDILVSNELLDDTEWVTVRFHIKGQRKRVCSMAPALGQPLLEAFQQLRPAPDHNPQRLQFELSGRTYDGRFVSAPTSSGIYFAVRLLDKSSANFPIDQLGIPEDTQKLLGLMLDHDKVKRGLVVCSGPLGSGKTVVLYSHLKLAMQQNVEIATLEDPIELDIPGLTQLQVMPEDKTSMNDQYRTLMSGALDYLMIGELRDADSIHRALRFSNSRGVVLSTMDEYDASSVLLRMHQECAGELWRNHSTVPKLLVNMRLASRLCQHCRQQVEPSDDDRDAIDKILETNQMPGWQSENPLWEAVGCDQCEAGYEGLAAAYEAFLVRPEMEAVCMNLETAGFEATRRKIREQAVANGMRTIGYHLWMQVLAGKTSLSEMRRMMPTGVF